MSSKSRTENLTGIVYPKLILPCIDTLILFSPAYLVTSIIPALTGLLVSSANSWTDSIIVVVCLVAFLAHSAMWSENEYFDRRIDEAKPRIAGFLRLAGGSGVIQRGALSPKYVLTVSVVTAVSALILATFVNLLFVFIVAVWLAVGHCYSAPPLRLKCRSGAGGVMLALNSVLAFNAGLVSNHQSIQWFPVLVSLICLPTFFAFHQLAHLADFNTDASSGIRTLPVALGLRRGKILASCCIVVPPIILTLLGTHYHALNVVNSAAILAIIALLSYFLLGGRSEEYFLRLRGATLPLQAFLLFAVFY